MQPFCNTKLKTFNFIQRILIFAGTLNHYINFSMRFVSKSTNINKYSFILSRFKYICRRAYAIVLDHSKFIDEIKTYNKCIWSFSISLAIADKNKKQAQWCYVFAVLFALFCILLLRYYLCIAHLYFSFAFLLHKLCFYCKEELLFSQYDIFI